MLSKEKMADNEFEDLTGASGAKYDVDLSALGGIDSKITILTARIQKEFEQFSKGGHDELCEAALKGSINNYKSLRTEYITIHEQLNLWYKQFISKNDRIIHEVIDKYKEFKQTHHD